MHDRPHDAKVERRVLRVEIGVQVFFTQRAHTSNQQTERRAIGLEIGTQAPISQLRDDVNQQTERPLNMNLETPTPSSPHLWRIAAAASLAGISPDLLERGIRERQIPVTLVVLGRMRYVVAREMTTWLKGNGGAPIVDLFAGSP